MYGIFTYMTGWFLGQMLVNISYMEHMGKVGGASAAKWQWLAAGWGSSPGALMGAEIMEAILHQLVVIGTLW